MRNAKKGLHERVIFRVAVPLLLILSVPAFAQRKILDLGLYEGESLVNSGKATVNAGNVGAQPMSGFGTGWSGNAQLFWGGGQPGAVLDLTLDVPAEGIYEVELHMTRAPDFGRLRIQIENQDVPQTFDGYAPSVVPSGAISLGTFDFQSGPRKVSFMIEGKNANSSNFFAGIDFIRLNKKPVLPQKTALNYETINITGLSVSPPTTHISDKQMGYMDGDKLTVKCSYAAFELAGEPALQIVISDNGSVKDSVGVTEMLGGTRTTSYKVAGSGSHTIKCAAVVIDKAKQTVADEKTLSIFVKGNNPQTGDWANNNPFIVSPTQNQQISGGNLVVKPYAPSQSHCSDGGDFVLDWQYKESPISGWKPLKKLSESWACVPDGSTKDLSGMKPGLYKVRAKETNGKYKFESAWSDWVTFEIVGN